VNDRAASPSPVGALAEAFDVQPAGAERVECPSSRSASSDELRTYTDQQRLGRRVAARSRQLLEDDALVRCVLIDQHDGVAIGR